MSPNLRSTHFSHDPPICNLSKAVNPRTPVGLLYKSMLASLFPLNCLSPSIVSGMIATLISLLLYVLKIKNLFKCVQLVAQVAEWVL